MLAEYRVGALAVVENVFDHDWINRKLKQLDERLFAEKQLTFAGEEVWCVVEDTGERYGAERFVVVYEFRDAQGRPIPYLTERIVEVMQKRDRERTDVLEARKIAQRRADERRQRIREENDASYRGIADDFERHRAIGNFMIVPRSPGLARARARARTDRVNSLLATEEARRALAAAHRTLQGR